MATEINIPQDQWEEVFQQIWATLSPIPTGTYDEENNCTNYAVNTRYVYGGRELPVLLKFKAIYDHTKPHGMQIWDLELQVLPELGED